MDPGRQTLSGAHALIVLGVSQKLSAGHGEAEVEPFGQNDPLVHATIVLAFLQKLPAGHGEAKVEPAGQ